MAGSLAALKNLPCPAGNTCTAFQCLFKHDNDDDTVSTIKSQGQLSTQAGTTSVNQDPPAKRIKLDAEMATVSRRQPAAQVVAEKPASEPTWAKKDQGSTSLQSEAGSSAKSNSMLPVGRKRVLSAGGSNQDDDKMRRDEDESILGEHAAGGITLRVGLEAHNKKSNGTLSDDNLADSIQDSKTVGWHTPHSSSLSKLEVQPSSAQSGNISTYSTTHPRSSTTSTSTPIHKNSRPPSNSPSAPQSQLSSSTKPKAASQKPEALNPRLLQKAPAKHDTRVKLVKALHEQYVRLNSGLKKDAGNDKEKKKLILSDQELIVKTLDDEQYIATRKFAIYGNAIRNRIMTYKRMGISQWMEERMAAYEASKPQDAGTTPTPPLAIITGLTPYQEVEFVRRFAGPLDALERFGYVCSIPSVEDIYKAQLSVQTSGNVEVCDRCTRRFQVFPGRREEDGALTTNGSCTYHPGKTYFTERGPDKLSKSQKKYRCCHKNVDDESGGCATARTHVFKTTDVNRLAGLLNFAETPPNPNVPADRAVCFDCEMGYTTNGLELIRITALTWPDYTMLLDVLVRPFGEVLDLNTRYSGVAPEDMVSAERWSPGDDPSPTIAPVTNPANVFGGRQKPKLKIVPDPKAARDLLFSLISPDTPLIGHGLENDLNAARIIHPTCVDTILLFPHRRGLPHRNGLRMLMDTLLNQKIQQETDENAPEGHDSAEDAKAAGDLVRLKVRDEWKDLRVKGWAIENGVVVPPSAGWQVMAANELKAHST
ncbi:hypothetical protein GGS26DRAFT_360351 [Hypomontagnella submonticulosa]|nr:hypothetical protein GGS26DRAFT_360351 [Hypomontagnella submonticulosa]